jgi:DNA-directed RNA polymerase specialized sigma24 family protein
LVAESVLSGLLKRKGEKTSPAFVAAKGGENMKDSNEQRVQNQFGGFCTRVLKNEANRIRKEYAKQRNVETPWDDLAQKELALASTTDQHFMGEHIFEVQGLPVVVTGDFLAEAISHLPERKREVILLAYFLGMNDREISEQLHVVRQTISKRRLVSLKELRKYLEQEGFEWPDL